jgi:hypothetical protein
MKYILKIMNKIIWIIIIMNNNSNDNILINSKEICIYIYQKKYRKILLI